MAKRVEMVRRATKKSDSPSIRIEKRAIQSRKASNFEVMRDSFQKFGDVRIRLSLTMRSEDGVYLGFNNTSIIVVAPTIEAAQAFPEKLRDAVAKLIEELGMTGTRKDAPL